MATDSINKAILFLLIVTVMLLLIIIIRLITSMQKSQRIHDQKIGLMKEMVVHLLESQEVQKTKVLLLDELKERLQHANRTLSGEIIEMIHELIQTLTQNNLLKK